MFYVSYWKRSPEYVAAAGLALLASALLFIETRSSMYLHSSSSLKIGFNGLALPDSGYFFNNWPFAYNLMGWMRTTITNDNLFHSSWQIISMLMFIILNVIGVLLTLSSVIFLASKPAWEEFRLLSLVVILSVIMTVFGAATLAADYDPYSLGGQMPLHIRWYLLGLGPTALWLVISRAQGRLLWSRETWIRIGLAIGMIFLVGRNLTLPSKALTAYSSFAITEDRWLALAYLHDLTPREAVVIAKDARPFSGIYGRSAYYEDIGGGVFDRLNPGDNRPSTIERLWATHSIEEFCSRISSTGASYLFDDISSPLQVENPPCLIKIWSSPNNVIRIFKLTR
jgi:hypothetical protein